MGKLSIFEITLNNPEGVYMAGQPIDGAITVELTEELKLRGIRVLFYGGANVRWSETRSTGKSTYTVVYSSSETYFNNEVTVFGKAQNASGETPTLAAGRYVYPFQFHLPQKMPSSFEGDFGRVRYWVKAEIDRPWKFNHKTKRAFTVFAPLDLNTVTGVKSPFQKSGTKHLCCLCCKSGPISATLCLDRCGFVPGESIAVKGEVTNRSNRKMKRSFAALMMKTTFHATSKSRSQNKTITEISKNEIPPGDSDTWNGELLHIPPLPPSELPGCRIIHIEYFVKLSADPAGPAFDLDVPIKICIGTVPLTSIQQQYGIPQAPPGLPKNSQLYTEAWRPDIPTTAPPSYAACTFGDVNIRDDDDNEHTRGNLNYTPMYAYYNWGQENRQTVTGHI